VKSASASAIRTVIGQQNAQPVTNVNFWIFVGVNPITIVSPTPVAGHGSNEAGTRDGN
jgi:hypothetical protein